MAALEAKAAGALYPSTKKRRGTGTRSGEIRGRRREEGGGGNERGNVL